MTDSVRRQGLLFLIVGGANTAFVYSLFVMLGLVMSASVAYTIAFVAGLTWVIFGTSRVVFKARSTPRMLGFGALYLAVYGAGRLVVHELHPSGIAELVVTSAALILLTVPISFVGGRLIFRDSGAR